VVPVPPTPPVIAADAPEADRTAAKTAADAPEADRTAAKTAADAAVDAYDQQVADFSEALSTYRDAQTAYTQWCDEDARAAAVLTASVLPQFASEFMALPTASEMWDHLCQRYQPSGDSLYLSMSVRSMLSSRVIPVFRSSTHRVLLFGAILTLSALLSVVLVPVAGL
jgi:hypothetical protein